MTSMAGPMINTNEATGDWVVREIQMTGGRVTQVKFDAFQTQAEAIADASERQSLLLAFGHSWDYCATGTGFNHPQFPDRIIIGVTKRNLSEVI